MEHYGVTVDDKSVKVGGKQRIVSPDGYHIPLQVKNGLPCMKLRPPTDKELAELPQVHLTRNEEWNPSVLDHEHGGNEWFDPETDDLELPREPTFNVVGDYCNREAEQHVCQDGDHCKDEDGQHFIDAEETAADPVDEDIDDLIDRCVDYGVYSTYEANNNDAAL